MLKDLQVVKRDGTVQNFSLDKILKAIKKANAKVSSQEKLEDAAIDTVVNTTLHTIKGISTVKIDVSEIHKAIENALMKHNCYAVAKQYISYRQERDSKRFKKSLLVGIMESKLFATNVVNQNANLDEKSFGGRKGEMDSAFLKEHALNYYISPKFAKNHINNRIYIHDLDSYILGMHNCESVPMDELLSNPVHTRQVTIRPAGSLNTAFQLLAVYFQLQSLQQFGGVAATHVDWTLVPYVRKSFMKHYLIAYLKSTKEFEALDLPAMMFQDYKTEDGIWRNRLEDWIKEHQQEYLKRLNLTIEDFYFDNKNLDAKFRQAAVLDTIAEAKQGAEGMLHNLNSLQSRAGNQLPFSSINYGTCTLPEGRIVTRAILDGTIRGTGNGQTSIFPCQIFQLMDGVNTKQGDPNYDLFKQAIKCTSMRMYPNYINCDWSRDQGYNKTDPRTYPSTMGCLDGKEHLYIKIAKEVYDISIRDLFEYAKTGTLKNARPAAIFFSKERFSRSGNCHIQEKSEISPGAGVYSITYKPLDVSYIGSSSDVCRRWSEHKCHIKLTGGLDAGPCFGDTDPNNYIFKVLEYTPFYREAEKHYIEENVTVNFKGTSQKYYKAMNTKYSKILTNRPDWKLLLGNQELINLEDKDIQVFDINNNWVKIKHVFRNDKKSSPYMMHIYYLEDNKKYCISATEDHPFFNGKDFTKAMDLRIGDNLYRADGKELPIISIGYHWEPVESFDIGTESGTFVGSDIKMHNCRTYSSWDINAPNEELRYLKDGRGNIAPATIILPTLAMEAKKKAQKDGSEPYIIDYFMSILEKALEDCRDELLERFDWICSQSAASADFMYKNKTFYYYDDDFEKEGIRGALKHGTLAIGQIGLAETLQILVGCDHTEKRGMDLAKRIEQLFFERCKAYKSQWHATSKNVEKGITNYLLQQFAIKKGKSLNSFEHQKIKGFCSGKFSANYSNIIGDSILESLFERAVKLEEYKHDVYRLNFGVYYTPAESLCGTAMKNFQKKYGKLPNISDREFFTNSIHVPVWKDISPFEKINIESELTGYSSAGCITYVEVGDNSMNNLEALEQLVLYAKQKDIPYFACNVRLSDCTKCGYSGYIPFEDSCPCCNADNSFINNYARVTGYLSTTIKHFNAAKQAETKARTVHVNNIKSWNKGKV